MCVSRVEIHSLIYHKFIRYVCEFTLQVCVCIYVHTHTHTHIEICT